MSTPTATPPTTAQVRDAVERLAVYVDGDQPPALGAPDLPTAVRTLLAAHADLVERHRDRGHRLAQLRIRVEAARTACQESGRYVETVDIERALDDRAAGIGTAP